MQGDFHSWMLFITQITQLLITKLVTTLTLQLIRD